MCLTPEPLLVLRARESGTTVASDVARPAAEESLADDAEPDPEAPELVCEAERWLGPRAVPLLEREPRRPVSADPESLLPLLEPMLRMVAGLRSSWKETDRELGMVGPLEEVGVGNTWECRNELGGTEVEVRVGRVSGDRWSGDEGAESLPPLLYRRGGRPSAENSESSQYTD